MLDNESCVTLSHFQFRDSDHGWVSVGEVAPGCSEWRSSARNDVHHGSFLFRWQPPAGGDETILGSLRCATEGWVYLRILADALQQIDAPHAANGAPLEPGRPGFVPVAGAEYPLQRIAGSR